MRGLVNHINNLSFIQVGNCGVIHICKIYSDCYMDNGL